MYCVRYWRVQKRRVNKPTNYLRKYVNSALHQLNLHPKLERVCSQTQLCQLRCI